METSTAAATTAMIAKMEAAAVMMVAVTTVATVSVLTAVAATMTTVTTAASIVMWGDSHSGGGGHDDDDDIPYSHTLLYLCYENRVLGTYLRYLPTSPTSRHCDNIPANPSWIKDISLVISNLLIFFDDSVKNSTSTQRPNFDVF
jgi:hypothetical protein